MRRRMMMQSGGGGGHNLPPEYQEVEWIGSTGTQYIDLQYKQTDADYVNIVLEYDGVLNGDIYGCGLWDGYLIIGLNNNTYAHLRCNMGYSTIDFNIVITPIDNAVDIQLSYNDTLKTLSVNGISDSAQGKLLNSVYNNYLFASMASGDAYCGKCKIRFFEAKKIAVNIRKAYPCYRKADHKPGMYDLVNGVFYTNKGTGEFIVGPDVN